MKRKIIAILTLTFALSSMILFSGCASCAREFKSCQSNMDGGLHRTVDVYDYNGNKIKTYEGKFDISNSENEVFFDIEGKRVIIHGGIVISEEK